jgi:hypothetical protein
MLRTIAERHKKQFEMLVGQTGREIIIQLAGPRVAAEAPVNKVLGRPNAVPASAPVNGPQHYVQAIVSAGYRSQDYAYGNIPASIASLGRQDPTMVVIRCSRTDVQEPGGLAFGDTYLHSAARVVIDNESFAVLGVDRSGLPPLDPYIIWAGLRRIGKA